MKFRHFNVSGAFAGALTSVVLPSNVRGDVGLFEGPPFEVLLVPSAVDVSLLALLATRFLLIAF